VRKALTSGRVLALSFVYFGVCYGLYALSFFLPTIVAGFAKQFGTKFSLVETGMIVAVPFLFGAVAMVANGHHSDKTGERRWHVAVPAVVAGVSIPVALYQQSPLAVMVAITFTAIGVCAALPVFWSLPSAFLTGAGAAAGIALINSLGNISGFAAPFVTGFSIDLTGSAKPALWMVGALLVGAAVITLSLGHAPRRAEDDAPVSERSGSTTA
jgi:nitrate/nitrite transporter NarK